MSKIKRVEGNLFLKHNFVIKQAEPDTLYHLNALFVNGSDEIEEFYLQSTCGCTLISEDKLVVSPFEKDTVKLVMNTYGKQGSFYSIVRLLNKKRTLVDSLKIDVVFDK